MRGITIRIRGKVQGVGFRPYVWQIAHELGLRGDVRNDAEGVLIHVADITDDSALFAQFTALLYSRCPPLAQIHALEVTPWQPTMRPTAFTISASAKGQMATHIVPDAATCPACLSEMRDPTDRRFGYPFINCTHCGPRFTIIRRMPYDRPYTAMAAFPMCAACQQEYDDPVDRRFHAQPNACPQCGPQIMWVDDMAGGHSCGNVYDDLASRACTTASDFHASTDSHQVIAQAVQALREGKIIAVRGLGGFHLACDATQQEVVATLRRRKHRPTKPLAVMLPSVAWLDVCADFSATHPRFSLCAAAPEWAAQRCREHALTALTSAAAPIVLVPKREHADDKRQITESGTLAANIAPSLNEVGVMLPASPLHHLLLEAFGRPLVMTSGNASGKPPALSNRDALQELHSIVDGWLLHNRDIVQRADDSLVRATPEGTEMLRRARGYAPDPLMLPQGFAPSAPILAMGGDLKNTFCLIPVQPQEKQADHAIQNVAVLSPHFGDLADPDLAQQVTQATAFFNGIYHVQPTIIAKDAHSGYFSTRRADAQYGAHTLIPVVHHHAHIAAVMAEHALARDHLPVLGLALDGIGMGENHALWGGECLLADYADFLHLGGMPATPLPGGDKAAREPWRNLLAQCHTRVPDWQDTALGDVLQPYATPLLCHAIDREINCPPASSCGRLFDAVAAALGICRDEVSFEGEAACRLESLAWSASAQIQERAIASIPHGQRHNGQQAFPLQMPLRLQHRPSTFSAEDECHGTHNTHATNNARDAMFNRAHSLPRCSLDLAAFWQSWLHYAGQPSDKAFAFHVALANGLAEMLCYYAKHLAISTIILSGGVLHNRLLKTLLLARLDHLTVLTPRLMPAGDGGLSLGQAVIAAAKTERQNTKEHLSNTAPSCC